MEVDAIEEGKIVHVSEEYAKAEGLMIIRKKVEALPDVKAVAAQVRRAERRARPLIDEFRRSLDYRKNNVIQELKENFQWELTRKRRERNITRRKLAALTGVSEDDIINLEHGILPQDNFVLIHKIEGILGVRLKKEQASEQTRQEKQTHQTKLEAQPESQKANKENTIKGEDIEVILDKE
jgi:ribosome-binding protein aMBF1 (putative translation factor)